MLISEKFELKEKAQDSLVPYAVSKAMLNGIQPEDWLKDNGKEVTPKTKILTQQAIIESNVIAFGEVLKDRLIPYEKIVEGFDAMKSERHSKEIKEERVTDTGKRYTITKYQTYYKMVPDHDTRYKFLRLFLFLTGKDPRNAERIKVTSNGSETSIEISSALLMVLRGSESEEDIQRKLDRLQDAERRGDGEAIDAEFKETPSPVGETAQ